MGPRHAESRPGDGGHAHEVVGPGEEGGEGGGEGQPAPHLQADRAAEALEGDGIRARVIDCYSIKPIDADALRAAARDCGAIVTVEDHWPEGGLGDAVLEALADTEERPRVVKLAVRDMPVSGTPEELLHAAGIDAEAIAAAARNVVGARA